jgi:hypothetical protein
MELLTSNILKIHPTELLAPNQITTSNLIIYVDADWPYLKDIPRPANGTTMGIAGSTAVLDLSNNGITQYTESTAASRPTYQTSDNSLLYNGLGGTNKVLRSNDPTKSKNASSLTMVAVVKVDINPSTLYQFIRISNSNASITERFSVGLSGSNTLRIRTTNTEGTTVDNYNPSTTIVRFETGMYLYVFCEVNYAGRLIRTSINNGQEATTTPSWSAGPCGNFDEVIVPIIGLMSGTGGLASANYKLMCVFKDVILSTDQKRKLFNWASIKYSL